MRRLGSLVLLLTTLVSYARAGDWGSGAWKDGRAEVAFYDAQRIIDGKAQAFKEPIIVKKEKNVFIVNQLFQYDSSNYPVRIQTGVSVRPDNIFQPVRVTVGIQDWTGNFFKVFDEGQIQTYSDENISGAKSLPLPGKPGDLFEDQLVFSLRALPFKVDYELSTRIWSSLAASRDQKTEPVEAVIKVAGEELIRTHTGSFQCWNVHITKGTTKDMYWFDKKEPHILVKMVGADGQTKLLTGRTRWSFWDKRIPKPKTLN